MSAPHPTLFAKANEIETLLENLKKICESVTVEDGDLAIDDQAAIICNVGKENEFLYDCVFCRFAGADVDKSGWCLTPMMNEGAPEKLVDNCHEALKGMFGIEDDWRGRWVKVGGSDWCRGVKLAVKKGWFSERVLRRNE